MDLPSAAALSSDTARMADDTQNCPAGTPDAVDSMAAELHGSMSMSPSARDRAPKRVITPGEDSRFKRVDSRRTPQKQRQRRAEMQLVTPQGEEDDVARRLWVQHDLAPPLAEAVARHEAKRKAKLREKEEADRKARYEEAELTYFEVPPLPEGATDADLERLEDEDLEAMYGR